MNAHPSPGFLRKIPLAVWLLGLPGLACLAAALALWAGLGQHAHPLLAEPTAALALLVSGIALLGSAGFPLALQRLADQDQVTDNPVR